MEKYRFDQNTVNAVEICPIPFAVYQFIDKRIYTIVLSAGFMKLFGYKDKEDAYYAMDNDMYCDTHPDDVAAISDAAFRFATEGGKYDVAYRTRCSECRDEYIMIHAKGEHIYTSTGERLAVVWYTNEGNFDDAHRDGQENGELSHSFSRMLREGGLIKQAHYDNLTGLPKMSYFFELAESARERAAREGGFISLAFFDLCRMRHFNRKYGFAKGDELLREFARLLKTHFSTENCCRFGQDYFAAYTESGDIENTITKIFEEARHLNGGNSLPVRAGIYLDCIEGIEPSEAVDRAKMAADKLRGTYASKYAFFDDSMLVKAAKRQHILDHFETALEQNWIRVYYQPIIRAANGRVCHEEALARWIDPIKGFLSPAEFIPVLEDAMLIYKLDLYVIKHVIAKMKRLRQEGLFVVPSSVNLSRADFDACDIVEEVRRIVDESGMPRSMLNIELTESMIGKDFEYMKSQIERFRDLGFHVWMDDFGSGYSSLDVLQRIQFDLVKLDMRFMQQYDENDKSRIILTELTKLATRLGIETVVEGVEKKEQVKFLGEIGCTMLQGFYYCKPIPMEAILERYRTGAAIGFENPAEAEYYSAIGAINLYDPDLVASEEVARLRHYFDTMPAAIFEVNGQISTVTRCNKSYREFMERMFGINLEGTPHDTSIMKDKPGWEFAKATQDCARGGGKLIVDEKIGGVNIHVLLRRIAVNPVTGTAAIAVVVLAIV